MLKRKIQEDIHNYLISNSNKILLIDGARQIGKSFIIRHEGKSLFPNYIELNMYEDKKGNKIYYKGSDGFEEWCEYDSNGNRIHYKDNRGCEQWREYDANGNLFHFKDNKGKERWY